MTTITFKHNTREAAEHQMFHLVAARAYDEFIESMMGGPSRSGNAKQGQIPPKPVPQDKKTTNAFPTAPLREHAINTCSTKLARFHYQLKSAKLNTKVQFMDLMRENGFEAEVLAVMTYRPGDLTYDTRDGLLAFLADGSPKLKLLFGQVLRTYYEKKAKLLVVEETPLYIKLYEDGLRAAWVYTELLYSKPTYKERQKLIDDFNNLASGLQILFLIVEVAS